MWKECYCLIRFCWLLGDSWAANPLLRFYKFDPDQWPQELSPRLHKRYFPHVITLSIYYRNLNSMLFIAVKLSFGPPDPSEHLFIHDFVSSRQINRVIYEKTSSFWDEMTVFLEMELSVHVNNFHIETSFTNADLWRLCW